MASFPAKIGWKRLRNKENKNYRYVPFQPKAKQKIKKKLKKIKKYHYGFISGQNLLENAEKERK